MTIHETLHDQFGPYGQTPEDLRAYVARRSADHIAHGWHITATDYRKELYWTGRYVYIAYVTYARTVQEQPS